MSDQEQKAAKLVVGTALFYLIFEIFQRLALPSLAVAYAQPGLSAGSFDLWSIVVSILGPAVLAYVAVASKFGEGVIKVVANLMTKVQSMSGGESQPAANLDKIYAGKSATSKYLTDHENRLKQLEETVKAWETQE